MKTAKISIRVSQEEMDAIDEAKINQGFKTTTNLIMTALKDYIQKLKKKNGNKETVEIHLSKTTIEQLEEIVENTDYQNKEGFVVDAIKEKIAEFQKTIFYK